MSLLMRLTRTLLRLRSNVFRSEQIVRASLAKSHPGDAPVPRRLQRSCQVSRSVIDGNAVITLTPRRGSSGRELLYVHGGAFIHPLVSAHWQIIRQLIRQTGATVTVPSYGLAPAHTAHEAYPFLDKVYRQVVARAGSRPVYLAGDSAGGGLCLGLAIRYRDQGERLPQALFLFSPFLDATLSNPDIAPIRPLDVMLDVPGLRWCAQQWAADWPLTDPRISPLYDSFAGLPPVFIYQGGHDIFVADAKKLAARTQHLPTPVDLHVYPDGFHVFVGATFTSEARQVFRHIGQVVRGDT